MKWLQQFSKIKSNTVYRYSLKLGRAAYQVKYKGLGSLIHYFNYILVVSLFVEDTGVPAAFFMN
jgi:hypothetical protein